MRFKISSIIICLVLTFTLVIIANIGNTDSDAEVEIGESTIIVSTYDRSVDVQKIFLTYQAEEIINTSSDTDNVSDSILSFNENDKDLLLKIGMCEAGGENVECIANVMCTVLNRVENEYFPNTIQSVLYQNGQFAPVSNGWIETVQPSDKCYEALEMIKSGWDESQGALYFESCGGDSWHSQNLEYLYSCGSMNFYR